MLVDQYGRSVKRRPVTDEIATVERDPLVMDYMGKIKLNPDKVIRTEGSGSIELYEDLLRDAKVGSALQTRRLAVIGKEWDVEPASDKRQDRKVSDYVKEVLKSCNYDAARQALLSGIVLGFKPGEIMWEYSEGDIWIKRIIPRASRRFLFGLDDKLRLITQANMVEGEKLPDRKFICFVNPSDNGSPYGDGIGRMLYWPVWFKKNAIKFWMIFADKFGSPTAIGKYPTGTSGAEQTKLLEALEAIQQESAIKIPDTMVIELLEAARSGTIDTYERLCAYMDDQIAQVLLGHTGSSQSTPGKLGSEDMAKEVREDYVKADADSLCECQNNSVTKWIVDYNFPNVMEYPKVWIRCEPEEDLKALADRDVVLVRDIGLPVTKQYFYDTYGIPEPEEGDELVEPRASEQVNNPASIEAVKPLVPDKSLEDDNPEFAEVNARLFDTQRLIDTLADNALAAGGIDIAVIRDLVAQANSYEDLQQRIKGAYGSLNMQQFRTVMEQAMFMADLAGRSLDGNR